MKYFYIIGRDTFITEVEYTQDKFDLAQNALQEKGIIKITPYGRKNAELLNVADVSKILDEEAYEAWTKSVKPREYIKNGTWFDGKERKVLRHEVWKQEEIDKQAKITNGENKSDGTSPEETREARERVRQRIN